MPRRTLKKERCTLLFSIKKQQQIYYNFFEDYRLIFKAATNQYFPTTLYASIKEFSAEVCYRLQSMWIVVVYDARKLKLPLHPKIAQRASKYDNFTFSFLAF